ncbi:helix-hairpin-helix domain-containing protein [Micromonospora sp. NPDC048170]|uniref:helix-hairpin-helix domain-containing protein n=1 Tax=Micromonospora sp. NPDC048170 TaxID=3154819 RepID=UPI0033C65D63
MAWSFGHWLILIVALAVGVAVGRFWRGRQGAAVTAQPAATVGGEPVAGMTAVVVDPPPTATLDEARPEVTVDPTPDAVADRVPDAPGADTSAAADPAAPDARPATVVAADMSRADAVDPADMALTGDPVPAPDTEPAPLDTATDARPGHEVVLPVAAEVTGPVDRRPAQESTPAAEPEDAPSVPAEPEVAPVPAATTAVDPEPVPATQADPEPAAATPAEAEPVPAAIAAEPELVPAAPTEPAIAAAVEAAPASDVPAEPESTQADAPVEPVVVPAPRTEVADSDAADDFRRIQGVGPKMAAALQAAGIRTYRQLAELDEAALRETIRAAGLRAAPSLATWPQQAKVLAGAGQEAVAALPTPVGGADA